MSESPRPIDYASPKPRWPVSRTIVLILVAVCIAVAIWVAAMVRRQATQATVVTSGLFIMPSPVTLAMDPMTIDLRQRGGLQLPGGKDTPYLSIGDITAGQVIITVTQANGPTILSKSLKEGDTATFSHGTQTLHLKLRELNNRLVGDDQATLELSASVPLNEADRIAGLIAHLETLDGATFIRNGSPHTAKEAADHLKRKRDYVGDKITTADQFIKELASESSQSGKPYTIKLKDGTEVPAGDYLKSKLPEIDAGLRGKK